MSVRTLFEPDTVSSENNILVVNNNINCSGGVECSAINCSGTIDCSILEATTFNSSTINCTTLNATGSVDCNTLNGTTLIATGAVDCNTLNASTLNCTTLNATGNVQLANIIPSSMNIYPITNPFAIGYTFTQNVAGGTDILLNTAVMCGSVFVPAGVWLINISIMCYNYGGNAFGYKGWLAYPSTSVVICMGACVPNTNGNALITPWGTVLSGVVSVNTSTLVNLYIQTYFQAGANSAQLSPTQFNLTRIA